MKLTIVQKLALNSTISVTMGIVGSLLASYLHWYNTTTSATLDAVFWLAVVAFILLLFLYIFILRIETEQEKIFEKHMELLNTKLESDILDAHEKNMIKQSMIAALKEKDFESYDKMKEKWSNDK